MFVDSTSLDHYVRVQGLDSTSDACAKFSQVFKNNLTDIDISNMASGNLYKYLQGKIANAFGGDTSISLVNSPSIDVKRIDDSVDTFTYNVLVDVHLVQDKGWMSKNRSDNNKYVIANATVKDMLCSVIFTPKLAWSGTSGTLTYDVKYSIDTTKPYSVKYNQIVYNYNGKTK
jgi:hypothetical protein